MSLLEFIFSSFWHFVGVCILLIILGQFICEFLNQIRLMFKK